MGNRLKLLIDYARLAVHEPRLAELHVKAIQTPTLTVYGDFNWSGWQTIKDELMNLVGLLAENSGNPVLFPCVWSYCWAISQHNYKVGR